MTQSGHATCRTNARYSEALSARCLTIVETTFFGKISERELEDNAGNHQAARRARALWDDPGPRGAAGQESGALVAIPKGKETDVKYYAADGGTLIGREAFEQMPKAGLLLWLAGNQFFARDDVVHTFQKQHPGTTVGLITLPPGLLLQAIKAGGWVYAEKEYRGLPDIYASVNLGHLKQLKASGAMDSYMV